MNSAHSSTTGFTPFYLNYGWNPSPMIWMTEEVYPGVRQFAEKMKEAIMSAHDAIISARVQHTVQANRKRLPAAFKQGDLVYLSTKNISLPKGRARKLSPKYLGPFPITKVIKEGATYQLGLSEELVKRGVNRAFHASLLRPHVPNDDRRFPGRLPVQIPGFGKRPEEWIVDSIVTHNGKGSNSEFLIVWKAGDKTWATYKEVAHLIALERYCELMGVRHPSDLPSNHVRDHPADEDPGDGNELLVSRCFVWTSERDVAEAEGYIRGGGQTSDRSNLTMVASPASSTNAFTRAEYDACMSYKAWLESFLKGGTPLLDYPPPRYEEFLQYNTGPIDHPFNPYHPGYYSPYPMMYPSFGGHQAPVTHQPSNPATVSMPASSLDTIVRMVGSQRERQRPAPRVVQYVDRGGRSSNRGYGRHARAGYRGRTGRGRGGHHVWRNRERREPAPAALIRSPEIFSTEVNDGFLAEPMIEGSVGPEAPVESIEGVTPDVDQGSGDVGSNWDFSLICPIPDMSQGTSQDTSVEANVIAFGVDRMVLGDEYALAGTDADIGGVPII